MLNELIIKVDNHNIHLSPTQSVPVRQTNFPIDHCTFRSHEDIFWRVELLEFNPDTNCWKMKVVDYLNNDIKIFESQKSTYQVDRIAFEKFDWLKLEPHLATYQKIKMIDFLENHDTERFFREENKVKAFPTFFDASISDQTTEENSSEIQHNPLPVLHAEQLSIIKVHKVEFSVYFSEANFKLGYVTFSKPIKEVSEKVDFKIKNDYLLAEFDNIKSWFAKKLKTKKFKVNATITTADGIITEVTATSSQIAMINAALIDSIKYQRTIALTKSPRVSKPDKSLFTSEDIFDEMNTDTIEGNVFSQNEMDIFNLLLDKNKTRNRKQLEYLSGNKQAENTNLRFTLHPNFGFLFFIEGKENNHFVWELLNSHATYIWSIDKSQKEIDLQYKRIEESINTIRNNGRENYKRAYRQNHLDNDLVFCVIEHDDIESNFVDGFVKWKHKLNEKIT